MTAVTTTEARHGAEVPSRYADKKLSFFGVLRSEFLKFRSLTTSWVMTAIISALMLGFSLLGALMVNTMYQDMKDAAADAPPQHGMEGMSIDSLGNIVHTLGSVGIDMGNMLVGSVAVVFLASEYANRSIHTTMTVVPKRSMIYLAKLLVVSLISFVLGFVLAMIGYLLAFQFINGEIQDKFPFENGVFFHALGVGLYFMMVAWMGIGFGALLRNNAGGIMMVVTLFLILPILLAIFSMGFDWASDMTPYLPSQVGRAMIEYSVPEDAKFNNVEAGGILALWCGIPALLGYLRFRFTDVKG
ncbi:ABC transporter permease subunit [Rothia sp. LK2588]|uniref:ABC transporter permease subunit n=1 Tax=Rothia sp. LK2588 TaxID=3114369 RepID=UPI0034CDBA78